MFYRDLLIYVFLQHAVFRTTEQCLDPTITVNYVNSCPESSTAWQEAALKKNCSTYGKTCAANTPVKYHCVMNTYRNATLEICAADVLIVGNYCPEYNEYGQLIQEHYGTICKTCPYYYYSTKVYKYPNCFQYQNVEEKKTTPLTTDNDYTTYVGSTSTQSAFESTTISISMVASTASTSKGTSASSQVIMVITLLCIGMLLIFVMIYCIWKQRNIEYFRAFKNAYT